MEYAQLIVGALLVCLIPYLNQAYFYKVPVVGHVAVSNKRQPFFDIARGLAIIAVIVIHAIYVFIDLHPYNYDGILTIINNLSRFAIPFFFLCSGILLVSSQGFYTRKLVRIFIPYLVVALAVGLYKELGVRDIVLGTISGSLLVPFYFVSVLFQLYILFPLLYKIRTSRIALWIVFIFSLLCAVIPSTWFFYTIPFFGQYLFFFFFGMYYRDMFLSNVSTFKLGPWILLAILDTILMCVFFDFYYNTRLFYGIALFIALFIVQDKLFNNRVGQNLQVFGRHSLWIFLIHFPIEYVVYLAFRDYIGNYTLLFIITILGTIVISFLLALALQYIYVKKITNRN